MVALALVTEERAVSVRVEARDPLLQAGVESCLRAYDELAVVGSVEPGSVALIVVDTLDDAAVRAISSARRAGRQVLLVVTSIDADGGLRAIRAGVGGVLPRRDASPSRLRSALLAVADGYGTLSPDLLGDVLAEVATAAPTPVLDDREKAVLALLADGYETAEVARRLAYSVRTVTSVVHDVTSRLQLRNRAHAVAYALREGLV